MTGTPLDLTPFGALLTGIGAIYWLLVAVGLRWAPRGSAPMRTRVVRAISVVLLFGLIPGQMGWQQFHARRQLTEAMALFEMHCRRAGEKINRSVENVDGIVRIKWRTEGVNLVDQFSLDDPYGKERDRSASMETRADDPNRTPLHNNMKTLLERSAFQSLAGKVRIDFSGANLRDTARDDFGAMASLTSLSPVTTTATNPANQVTLDGEFSAAWGETYENWLTDRDMSMADREAGRETFTGKWIADRSELIGYMAQRNMRSHASEALSTYAAGGNAYWYEFIDAQGVRQRISNDKLYDGSDAPFAGCGSPRDWRAGALVVQIDVRPDYGVIGKIHLHLSSPCNSASNGISMNAANEAENHVRRAA